MSPIIEITGSSSTMLLIADHASNHVPAGIQLGIPPELLGQHVAIDIGVEALGRRLCAMLDCAGILGGVSRLVIDYNREIDAPGLIPVASDGHAIPGNAALSDAGRAQRVDDFWRPYHDRIADLIAISIPNMLISLHSFTPKLATSDEPRPWEIGVLHNRDDRAAAIAIPLLEAAGIVTGDNLPYSGKVLNATMNRHGEGNGIAYLGLEVRQDLIGDDGGVAIWAEKLALIIAKTAEKLA